MVCDFIRSPHGVIHKTVNESHPSRIFADLSSPGDRLSTLRQPLHVQHVSAYPIELVSMMTIKLVRLCLWNGKWQWIVYVNPSKRPFPGLETLQEIDGQVCRRRSFGWEETWVWLDVFQLMNSLSILLSTWDNGMSPNIWEKHLLILFDSEFSLDYLHNRQWMIIGLQSLLVIITERFRRTCSALGSWSSLLGWQVLNCYLCLLNIRWKLLSTGSLFMLRVRWFHPSVATVSSCPNCEHFGGRKAPSECPTSASSVRSLSVVI